MLVTIADVLKPDELAHIRGVLERTTWVDGRVTAGDQAAKVKNNLQVPIDSRPRRNLAKSYSARYREIRNSCRPYYRCAFCRRCSIATTQA